MLALNGGSKDDLEIHPNVWAGVGLVRGGAGTALVGSYDEVAAILKRLSDAGLNGMALASVNYVQEMPIIRDEVLPRLERLGLREPQH